MSLGYAGMTVPSNSNSNGLEAFGGLMTSIWERDADHGNEIGQAMLSDAVELEDITNRASSEFENLLSHTGQSHSIVNPILQSCSRDQPFPKKHTKAKYSGWRAGVLSCSITALTVLIINFALMVWASAKYSVESGFGVLYQGNCSKARGISTALHILINILSTVLLSASNYTMQCLNSPTRKDVDRAHAKKVWLDIGIPSWRNRQYVGIKAQILWWGLGFSSIPLHFLYNSSVFLDLAGQQYQAYVTNATIDELQATNLGANFTSMTWEQCESTYNRIFVFGNGDVYIVTPDSLNGNHSNEQNGTPIYNWEFALNRSIDIGQSMAWNDTYFNASKTSGNISISGDFTSDQFSYTACYSEKRTEYCRIKFSIGLICVVIFCNASKAICMFITFWFAKESTLVTLGDAIASFLEDPDPTTKGLCVVSKFNIQNDIWKKPREPMLWHPIGEKTFQTTTTNRWITVNFSLIGAGLLGLILAISLGAAEGMSSFKTGIGFGSSLKSMPPLASTGIPMTGSVGLFLNTVVVNTPQSIVSLMNVLYNSLFTCMLLGDEWNTFAFRRQPLRVTAPVGEQKSNYYLTIPYPYAIPIIILSGTLHWLISESLFLVRVTALDHDQVYDDSLSSMGYSPLAIALSCLVCFLMLALVNIKALQKYKPGMPLVGSCSAGISAACHPPRGEVDISLKAVQWGAVKSTDESFGVWGNRDKYKDVGHCSFSSLPTEPPIPGRYYAGEISFIASMKEHQLERRFCVYRPVK